MPYSVEDSDQIDANLSSPRITKGNVMEPNQMTDGDTGAALPATSGTELVTETLVEEVSIDGMCGVY
jgi:mycofactocin precursor peptide MftA